MGDARSLPRFHFLRIVIESTLSLWKPLLVGEILLFAWLKGGMLAAYWAEPDLREDMFRGPTITLLFLPYFIACLGWSRWDARALRTLPLSRATDTLLVLIASTANSVVWVLAPFTLFFFLNGWLHPHLYLCLFLWLLARIVHAAVIAGIRLIDPYLSGLAALGQPFWFIVGCCWPLLFFLPGVSDIHIADLLLRYIYDPEPDLMVGRFLVLGSLIPPVWLFALAVHALPVRRQTAAPDGKHSRNDFVPLSVGRLHRRRIRPPVFAFVSPWMVQILAPMVLLFLFGKIGKFLVHDLEWILTSSGLVSSYYDSVFRILLAGSMFLLLVLGVLGMWRLKWAVSFIYLWRTLPIRSGVPIVGLILLIFLIWASWVVGKTGFLRIAWDPMLLAASPLSLGVISFAGVYYTSVGSMKDPLGEIDGDLKDERVWLLLGGIPLVVGTLILGEMLRPLNPSPGSMTLFLPALYNFAAIALLLRKF